MFSVSFDLSIKSPPETVFKALTEQELLTRWFAPQVIAVPVEGTVAAFAFEFDLNFKMELVLLNSNSLVHWKCVDGYKEWLHSEVLFKLIPSSKGTKLHFEHNRLINVEKKQKTTLSWKQYLEKLKKLCETNPL